MPKITPPMFAGLQPFGDPGSFRINALNELPGSIDTFLGNPPGTTQYAPGGGGFAISGAFFGPSQAAVQQQISTLLANASVSSRLGYPTGLRFPDDFRWAPHYCFFLPAEFKPGAIVPYAGGQYTAPYLVVFRQTAPVA